MHSFKDSKNVSNRARAINQELIDFDKQFKSSMQLFHSPTEIEKKPTSTLFLEKPYHNQKMASSISTCLNLTSSNSLNGLPQFDKYSEECSIFQHEAKEHNHADEVNAYSAKTKIQRRDASDDLSSFFR